MTNQIKIMLFAICILCGACQKSQTETREDKLSGRWNYEKASYYDKVDGGNHNAMSEFDESELTFFEDGTLNINKLDSGIFYEGFWTLVESSQEVPLYMDVDEVFLPYTTIDAPIYHLHLELRDTSSNLVHKEIWTEINIRKNKTAFNYRTQERTYRFKLIKMD